MQKITRIIFDLVPAPGAGQNFIAPHAYVFRGVIMGWLDQFKHEIGERLHMKQPKNTPMFYGDYALQQQYLYLGQGGWSTQSPRIPVRPNSGSNRNYTSHEGPEGLRYLLNIFDDELAKKFFELIMQRQDNTVQFGPQQAIIAGIKLETVDMDTWILQTRPVQKVTMTFASPICFNMMGAENELRIPLPEYFWSYLYKFWNHLHQDPALQIAPTFYEWVKANVGISSFELKTKGWEMGKDKKMVGGTGWATYLITGKNEKNARWLDVLMKLAEYSGVGNNRTAGFGRVWHEDVKYQTETVANVCDMPEDAKSQANIGQTDLDTKAN